MHASPVRPAPTARPVRLALAVLLAASGACRHVPDPEPGPLGRHVDPFIGTGGIPWASGMLFPGATAPFGAVRLSPDTSFGGGLFIGNMGTAGYADQHGFVRGFSHTRLSGTGATDGQHFRVKPAVGAVDVTARASEPLAFDHADEVAAPGFYAVWLPGIETLVELTATAHVGVHRYGFPAGEVAHLLFDATSFPGDGRSADGHLEVRAAERELVGDSVSFGSFSGRYGGLRAYFVARFDTPIESFATWRGDEVVAGRTTVAGDDVGADLRFAPGSTVEMSVGLSFVSLDNARANLDAEVGAGGFDAVYGATRSDWEEWLGRAYVESDDPSVLEIFYTSLYHSFIMPTDFTDVNGEYLGFDGTVGVADDFTYRTDLSLWDTFRTTHPLYTLIAPDIQRDSVKSLVRMARIGGTLPRWPSGGGYTGSMFGTPADMLVAESYLKGITDFEVEEAYGYMRTTALQSGPPGADDREGIEDCIAYGFCPADLMTESVARTLEFAWADASIANLAEALGESADAAYFRDRSYDYAGTWNPATGFFQPRNADGSFAEPFFPDLVTFIDDALFGGRFANDFVEGSAHQWRYSVPHDPDGLISLFGGAAPFVEELDGFMRRASAELGAPYMGPGYWHGNQHDMHAIYLFNDAGRPDLTQRWVRWALTQRYGLDAGGLDGNDDGGTVSAWYVLSAVGLYPVAGSDRYWVGAPIVDRAELDLGNGRSLVVTTAKQGRARPYVSSVTLDGVRLCEPHLRHADLARGGTLRFVMSDVPAPGGGYACP